MGDHIKNLVQQNHETVVALRRHFHMHPELSNQEFNTQKRILDELAALGITAHKAAGTGVIGELKGAKPGKTIAARADIDALQLQDECGKPYQSQTAGVCHACGHDGHTAMLLGVARVLSSMRDELPGTVRFLFEPSEESLPGGALPMIKEGAVAGADAIVGAHLWQPLSAGTIGITYGWMMAAADGFDITVKGRGGHGSMPHQTVDALLVGAQIVTALHTIVSRNVDPLCSAVLSIGTFKSGDVFNIIPDTAVIKGTVRTFEETVRQSVFAHIQKIAQGICDANGAECEIENTFGYPALRSTPAITKVVAEAGTEVLGAQGVLEIPPVMGAEDFSYYQEKIPGAFMFIGIDNPEKGTVYPQHHPKYDIDEQVLAYGVEIITRTIWKLLKS